MLSVEIENVRRMSTLGLHATRARRVDLINLLEGPRYCDHRRSSLNDQLLISSGQMTGLYTVSV